MKPDMRNVTAIVFDHRDPRAAVKMLAAMSDLVDFGDIKYLNHFQGWRAFNYWENYEAWKYVQTDYALYMHLDGYIVHPECWDPAFLSWDYIGAPWPETLNKDRVGNGGFSLRSRAFMLRVSQLPWQDLPGDVLTCSFYRQQLITEGYNFAPVSAAAAFSIENRVPETPAKTFGFHGTMHYPAWTAERSAL